MSGIASDTTGSRPPVVEFVDGIHPVIDISSIELDGGDHGRRDESTAAAVSRRSETLVAMRSALQNRGYFYARGVTTLPANYIDEIYAYSKR